MENGSTSENVMKDVICQDETVLDPRVKVIAANILYISETKHNCFE